MILPDLRLQKPLEDYVEYLEKLNRRVVPLIDKYADPFMIFSDPVHNLRGLEVFKKLLVRRFELYPAGQYKVQDFCWGRIPSQAYVTWSFTYKPLLRNRTGNSCLSGATSIGFSHEGKIASIDEFWGAGDAFTGKAYAKPIEG